MHRFMDGSCSNCNKFSHCCNNDLICISKYKEKEQECEALKGENFTFVDLIKTQEEQLDDDNVIIERFLIASGKSKDITEPDEFEEVFQDIEQTYSEHEELNKECKDLKQELQEVKKDLSECEFDRNLAQLEANQYKQALDEIEKFCTVYSANHDAYETVYKDILAFINKAKEGNNDR